MATEKEARVAVGSSAADTNAVDSREAVANHNRVLRPETHPATLRDVRQKVADRGKAKVVVLLPQAAGREAEAKVAAVRVVADREVVVRVAVDRVAVVRVAVDRAVVVRDVVVRDAVVRDAVVVHDNPNRIVSSQNPKPSRSAMKC